MRDNWWTCGVERVRWGEERRRPSLKGFRSRYTRVIFPTHLDMHFTDGSRWRLSQWFHSSFLDPYRWKRRHTFPVELVIIAVFFIRQNKGPVKVERGAQLTVVFEKRFRIRALTCYLKTMQRKKTQRARWVRGRTWNSERVEGRGPRYDLCVGSWYGDRNRPIVKVKKENNKKQRNSFELCKPISLFLLSNEDLRQEFIWRS